MIGGAGAGLAPDGLAEHSAGLARLLEPATDCPDSVAASCRRPNGRQRWGRHPPPEPCGAAAGCVPDYTMVVVGSNMGVLRMTKEHLGVALALKYPLIFAVRTPTPPPREFRVSPSNGRWCWRPPALATTNRDVSRVRVGGGACR